MILAELNVTAQINIQVHLLDGNGSFLFLPVVALEYDIFIMLL
jgi:hypothetical protein